MKKVNFIAIAAICIVAMIAVVLVFFLGNRDPKGDTMELLKCSTVSDVEDYIRRNKIEKYNLDAEHCTIENVSIFGQNAIVEILFENNAVSRMNLEYTLFQDSSDRFSVEESESSEIVQYEFSQEKKQEIDGVFNEIKSAFERYLDCSIEQYDLIPTKDGVAIDQNDELFYQGLLIKEYSVRDRNNVLWLLRYQAADGMAHATLIKVVDDSGFEGFIPVVDLTKA